MSAIRPGSSSMSFRMRSTTGFSVGSGGGGRRRSACRRPASAAAASSTRDCRCGRARPGRSCTECSLAPPGTLSPTAYTLAPAALAPRIARPSRGSSAAMIPAQHQRQCSIASRVAASCVGCSTGGLAEEVRVRDRRDVHAVAARRRAGSGRGAAAGGLPEPARSVTMKAACTPSASASTHVAMPRPVRQHERAPLVGRWQSFEPGSGIHESDRVLCDPRPHERVDRGTCSSARERPRAARHHTGAAARALKQLFLFK